MVERTPHFGLPTGVAADEFIDPEHHNSVANALDSVVGGVLANLARPGVHSGWLLTSDGAVSAGCGLVGTCWCQTQTPSPVQSLVRSATNHVWAAPLSSSPARGEVVFVAQLLPPGPGGGVYLGTLTVDSSGECVDAVSDAPGVERSCFRVAFGRASGRLSVGPLAPGQAGDREVEHGGQAEFRIPGALSIEALTLGCQWTVLQHHEGSSFVVRVANQTGVEGVFELSWTREGLLR